MAYKPEEAGYHSWLTKKSERRARRDAKKAATRLARRAAKRDPENAPVRFRGGYID